MTKRNRIQAFFMTAFVLLPTPAAADTSSLTYQQVEIRVGSRTQKARIPNGYRLEVLTEKLEGPRLLTFADNGDLFIGSKSGKVYLLSPPYREARVLVQLEGYPHSVDFRADEILIALTDGVYRADFDPGQRRLAARDLRLLAALPGGGGHSSRTLRVGPDGRIYLGLGISGNCSDEYLGETYPFADRRGGVLVLDEGARPPAWRSFASGLRNPVGFDWHPQTGTLFASNNGPDHRGFELPPEYFSRLEPGSFHGMPWYQFNGQEIQRDRCIGRKPPLPASAVPKPVATFPARNAPMAVAFVPRGAMAPALEGDALVALRGSWATRPFGQWIGDPASKREPKIVAVRFDAGNARRVDDLVTGFQLPDGDRWARPVGVAIGPDGALYFTSDSGANALFRLRKQTGRHR
jgi:glucose/arabinose dehydrogenase